MGDARDPDVVLVAAVARNGVIGRSGKLPWRLKSDLARFRELTLGAPIVMGRRTWESLPKRPLPGRINIVMSSDPGYRAAGAALALDVETARLMAVTEARILGADVMVIGGAGVYRAFLPYADCLYLTEVDAEPKGDVRFPAIDPQQWREADRREAPVGPEDDHGFAYVRYERIKRR